MKLEHGDAFEAQYVHWIRERLPHYEPIWSAFVGHNGRGWPLPIPGLTIEQERRRKKFYQAHYTFAVDAYQLDILLTALDRKAGNVGSLAEFLDDQLHLILAMALTGQIRDMFEIIDNAFDMGGVLFQPLQDFYAQRSNILHGPRMPVSLNGGFVSIPKVGTQTAIAGDWDSKGVWTDVDTKSFLYFTDWCQTLRADLFELLGRLHPKIFPAADSFFDKRRVVEQDFAKASADDTPYGLSVGPEVAADLIPPSGVIDISNVRGRGAGIC